MKRTLMVVVSIFVFAACQTNRPPATYVGKEQKRFSTPAWFRKAVFYEIFVRSFLDTDGDGRGDFRGMTRKLDYLQKLGVTAIWLMPINPSPSYHGYDVTNYTNVNPQYGSMADFEAFIKAAHAKGIRVIMDLVINHSSSRHPWFIKSASSPSSPFRHFYVWEDKVPRGFRKPWGGGGRLWHRRNGAYYYGVFYHGMPDLNHNNPRVRQEVKKMIAFWLKKGVDGFRLDAIRYLIETGPGKGQMDTRANHRILQEYAAYMKSINPRAVMVGEAWSSVEDVGPYYGKNNELDAAFNFDLAGGIIQAVKQGQAGPVYVVYMRMRNSYPARYQDAPFLRNHDQPRLPETLGDTKDLKRAATLLLTLPGTPFLYYGEEIAMRGGKPDPNIRRPMQWSGANHAGFTSGTPWKAPQDEYRKNNVARQMRNPRSLWNHYRNLLRLRTGHPGLAMGKFKRIRFKPFNKHVLLYRVDSSRGNYLVAHHLGEGQVTVTVKDAGTAGRRVWNKNAATWAGTRVVLGGQASGIFRVR